MVSNGVANVPTATNNDSGVVKVSDTYGTFVGDGIIKLSRAPSSHIKSGTGIYKPITPGLQHESTFYGLAKAAGADMKDISSTTVGVYPEEQKSAISEMLNGSVSVSGSTPNITAKSGIRYVCGECATLDINVPATGDVEVIFISGSTPTVLTITPPTGVTEVQWANGFDATALEANARYDIIITDGEWGLAASWAL